MAPYSNRDSLEILREIPEKPSFKGGESSHDNDSEDLSNSETLTDPFDEYYPIKDLVKECNQKPFKRYNLRPRFKVAKSVGALIALNVESIGTSSVYIPQYGVFMPCAFL